jgi:large subunit ribosomal protein L15
MPLHRRLPKRGFNIRYPEKFNEINVGAIQKAIDEKRLDGTKPIDNAGLIAAGIMRRPKHGLRLLGEGEIKAKIAITVDHVSAGAKAAVEKAGGSVTVIAKKILEDDVKKAAKTKAKKAKNAPKKAAGEE